MKRLSLIFLLLWTSPSIGKEVLKVVFVGPGVSTVQEFSSESDLNLWDSVRKGSYPIERPEQSRLSNLQSFTVDVHVGSNGETVAIDEYRFFPKEGEERGYLYYVNVRGGWSTQVGSWFAVSNESEDAMMQVVKAASWPPSK